MRVSSTLHLNVPYKQYMYDTIYIYYDNVYVKFVKRISLSESVNFCQKCIIFMVKLFKIGSFERKKVFNHLFWETF